MGEEGARELLRALRQDRLLHQDEAVAAADLQPPGGCWLQAGHGVLLWCRSLPGLQQGPRILPEDLHRGCGWPQQGVGTSLPGLRGCKGVAEGVEGPREVLSWNGPGVFLKPYAILPSPLYRPSTLHNRPDCGSVIAL